MALACFGNRRTIFERRVGFPASVISLTFKSGNTGFIEFLILLPDWYESRRMNWLIVWCERDWTRLEFWMFERRVFEVMVWMKNAWPHLFWNFVAQSKSEYVIKLLVYCYLFIEYNRYSCTWYFTKEKFVYWLNVTDIVLSMIGLRFNLFADGFCKSLGIRKKKKLVTNNVMKQKFVCYAMLIMVSMIGLRFNLVAEIFWVKEQIKYKKMTIIKRRK